MIKKLMLMLIFLGGVNLFLFNFEKQVKPVLLPSDREIPVVTSSPVPSLVPGLTLSQPPSSKILENDYHVFQTFNNCGPAALSMALSYFGVKVSQKTLGDELRPYQITRGIDDDKSVGFEEMAEKVKEFKLISYHRPNGNINLLKLFLTYDLSIVVRTWTKTNEDISHFRVIKGFDDITGELIQDDSLQGKNLHYSYTEFNNLWQKLNYEYLVIVPENKKIIVEKILGEDLDTNNAWQKLSDDLKEN